MSKKKIKEEWRKTSILPSNIEVSNLGNVRKYVNSTDTVAMKINQYSGYSSINYESNTYHVHRLIADAFVPNPDNLSSVNHKNGDKTDNRAENLEWVSQSSNFYKNYVKGSDSRKKVYCKELDKVFGTLQAASFFTLIPQVVLSESIRTETPVYTLSFKYIEGDDELLTDHNVFYVSAETMFEIATHSDSIEKGLKKLYDFVGDGVKRVI